jgi:arsenate reductase
VHNSFRSQIAEAILNYKYGDTFEAESAGLTAIEINPLAIKVMRDYGIDISKNKTNNVFDFFKEGRLYEYVITVCSKEAENKCPVFPGIRKRINWNLEDPETFTGTEEEKYQKAVQLMSEIENRIDDFAKLVE